MNLERISHSADVVERDEAVLLNCQRAKDLEMDGNYAAAREALRELWQGVGMRPYVEGLGPLARGEALLRVGTLSGWLGSAQGLERSQEIAKDLISESSRVFEQLGLPEMVAEAAHDLAICYWREGGFDEARATLRHVLSQLPRGPGEVRLRTLLNLSLIERSSTRYNDALAVHREAAPLFENCTSHSLRGKFHNEYATVLKNLGLREKREDYIDQALLEYAAAGFHLEQVGNKRFQGVTENNQGLLFSSIGRFPEAHQHLDRAQQLFFSIGDKASMAQVDETRARVFLAQGRNVEAEAVVRSSVHTFEQSDERALLAEALTTHGTAYARLHRQSEAYSQFTRAIEVAQQAGDLESAGVAALSLVEELNDSLAAEAKRLYRNAEVLLTKSQDSALERRLGQCARRVLAAEEIWEKNGENSRAGIAEESIPAGSTAELLPSGTLEKAVLSYEGTLIRKALEASRGSVTRAARMLGITHQGLAFILNGRHNDLLSVRTPPKPRRRSIIRRH